VKPGAADGESSIKECIVSENLMESIAPHIAPPVTQRPLSAGESVELGNSSFGSLSQFIAPSLFVDVAAETGERDD
jgi:hypothetical protein